MDQKVVCVFLLIIGICHGLQCYKVFGHGREDNFDAATARKITCQDWQDVCVKGIQYII